MRASLQRLSAAGLALLLAGTTAALAADRRSAGSAGIGRVALLPFTTRGPGPEAWPVLRQALRRAMSGRGITLAKEELVAEELHRRRLRDTSILLYDEMAAVAEAVGAQRLLLGYLYRMEDGRRPMVAFSGRLIDPRRREIEAMAFTAVDGGDLRGALRSGEPVTMERTLEEAVSGFVDALVDAARGDRRRKRPRLLEASMLAPDAYTYFSKDLEPGSVGRIVVLPFRSRVEHPGAGQAAADLISWSLASTGGTRILEAGDASRRLLERGWRTGAPVGTDEVLSLGLDPGVDAVLMGSVDRWIEGDAFSGRPPRIGLSARLLDARTGEILWAAEHERRGDETLVIYDIGNVRVAEALLARAASEMLDPLLELLRKSARARRR